jgi:DNA sulfur modification protein DndD
MILQELRLHNFCIYRGRHQFDLTPVVDKGRYRPIVLFGGMNGGGKTTLLDAVQLIFYGKRGTCSKRGDSSYEDFLKSCINNAVPQQDGASVGLSFAYASEGREQVYDVDRSWSISSSGTLRERVVILRDGEPDPWMSDNWPHIVDDLIPFGVAQLCFFDAEKVRFLAEQENCSEALGNAIKSLLGLDLAERLMADAALLEGRIARRIQKSAQFTRVEELEVAWRHAKEQAECFRQQKAGLAPELERAALEEKKVEADFARVGGRHWENHARLMQEKAEITRGISLAEEHLIAVAGGVLPLALCSHAIQVVIQQANSERSTAEAIAMLQLLEERDRSILQLLEENAASAKLQRALDQFLREDRSIRGLQKTKVFWLEFPDIALRRTDELLQHSLPELRAEVLRSVHARLNLQKDLDRVERSLAAVPKDDAIREVTDQLRATCVATAALKQKMKNLEDELRAAETRVEECAEELSRLRHKCVDEQIQNDANARICSLTQRTQGAMKEFLRRATERKMDRLSEKVTECFRYLLHKERFVSRVVIDPSCFRISLFDEAGEILPKDRLSEGEKQIFAISVLWGLSQCSARPLPAIIDTPMGRLDSAHRSQMVGRYFPHASHQVIILSTDTEIERGYFEQLENSIARAYHLRYDDVGKQTSVHQGYFW